MRLWKCIPHWWPHRRSVECLRNWEVLKILHMCLFYLIYVIEKWSKTTRICYSMTSRTNLWHLLNLPNMKEMITDGGIVLIRENEDEDHQNARIIRVMLDLIAYYKIMLVFTEWSLEILTDANEVKNNTQTVQEAWQKEMLHGAINLTDVACRRLFVFTVVGIPSSPIKVFYEIAPACVVLSLGLPSLPARITKW